MLKKLFFSILCLVPFTGQAIPRFNPRALYPFIGMQYAIGMGYYFKNAFDNWQTYKLIQNEGLEKDLNKFYNTMSYRETINKYGSNGTEEKLNLQPDDIKHLRKTLRAELHQLQENQSQRPRKVNVTILPSDEEKENKFIERLQQIKFEESEIDHALASFKRMKYSAGINTIHVPLEDVIECYRLSLTNDGKKRALEDHLARMQGVLGHELSHIEHEDVKYKILATALVPFATEALWKAATLPFGKKPLAGKLSVSQLLLKGSKQLPIGAAKFCISGALLGYYYAFQERRCDREGFEYMGAEATEQVIYGFERVACLKEKIFRKEMIDETKYLYYNFTPMLLLLKKLEEKLSQSQDGKITPEIKDIAKEITELEKTVENKAIIFVNNNFAGIKLIHSALYPIYTNHPTNHYRAKYLRKLIKQSEQEKLSE